jgi:prevent-host-death family protein
MPGNLACSWRPCATNFGAVKTATIRQLRNSYAQVLRWVAAGEEVEVTKRGKVVAKVVPSERTVAHKMDWTQSAAFGHATWSRRLSATQSAALLADSQDA